MEKLEAETIGTWRSVLRGAGAWVAVIALAFLFVSLGGGIPAFIFACLQLVVIPEFLIRRSLVIDKPAGQVTVRDTGVFLFRWLKGERGPFPISDIKDISAKTPRFKNSLWEVKLELQNGEKILLAYKKEKEVPEYIEGLKSLIMD